MKELRSEVSHEGYAEVDLDIDERRKRPRGERPALSSADAAAFRGKRVRELDDDAREDVADAALADRGGTLPYKAEMEARFGRSFDHVHVSSGDQSSAALEGVGADGVTRGNSIAFRDSSPSREVVAHELTHVVQNEGGSGASRPGAEREAFGAEAQLRGGGAIEVVAAGSTGGRAHFRDPSDDFAGMYGSGDTPFAAFNPRDVLAAKDETPVDWSGQSRPPPDPFELVDCTLRSHAPVVSPRNQDTRVHGNRVVRAREFRITQRARRARRGARRDARWASAS